MNIKTKTGIDGRIYNLQECKILQFRISGFYNHGGHGPAGTASAQAWQAGKAYRVRSCNDP